jgi:Spy/CpxP family protein refolding chaperone
MHGSRYRGGGQCRHDASFCNPVQQKYSRTKTGENRAEFRCFSQSFIHSKPPEFEMKAARNTKAVRWLGLVALLIVLCAATSWITVHIVQASEWRSVEYASSHAWLHDELSLTMDESQKIEDLEGPYQEERSALLDVFDERIQELTEILRGSDGVTPEVNHAIHRLHEVHGDLQQLAIAHYFQMLDVLPPEKQDRLRALAVEALSEPE